MTNNVVEVCSADGSCNTCGTVTGKIGRSQWAEIVCGALFSGTSVKVSAANSFLQIAEIEVFGNINFVLAPVNKTIIPLHRSNLLVSIDLFGYHSNNSALSFMGFDKTLIKRLAEHFLSFNMPQF